MQFLTRILSFFVPIMLLFISEIIMAENISLSENEIRKPHGVYQIGVNMERSRQIDIKAPRKKPLIKWSKQIDNEMMDIPVLTDIYGGIWYTHGYDGWQNVICKLDKDGKNVLKEILPSRVLLARPVVILNGAVIFIELRVNLHNKEQNNLLENMIIDWDNDQIIMIKGPNEELADIEGIKSTLKLKNRSSESLDYHVCLHCFDLEGKEIWKTENVEVDFNVFDAWRTRDNMVILPVGELYAGHFNMYSLANGELMESLILPGYKRVSPYDLGPLYVDYNRWIGYKYEKDQKKSFLTCYNSDGTVYWQSNIPLPICLNTFMLVLHYDVIISGTRDFLRAFNVNTGDLIWQKSYSRFFVPTGYNLDNNIVIEACSESKIMVINPVSGENIWSKEYTFGLSSGLHFVIFEGGEMMFGHRLGLTLLDKDGALLWTIDHSDLNISTDESDTHLVGWSINPISTDSIVVSFMHLDEDKNYIVYLRQPE